MMKTAKISTVVLLMSAVFSVLAAPVITASGHKATVKVIDRDSWLIAFEAAPKDWVLAHLQFSAAESDSNFVAFTIEQVKPAGLSPKRIILQLKTGIRGEAFFNQDIRVKLRDNKPHRYSSSVPEGKKLNCISLIVDRPAAPVVLKISKIVLEKRNIKARKNTPLPPVMFKGKPFFPIGAFDMTPNNSKLIFGEIDPDFLAAGGNIGFIGQVGLPEHPLYARYFQPALENALKIAASDPKFADVALMVSLAGISVDESQYKTKGYLQKVSGNELVRRQKLLADALKMCAKNPNVIGYYLDEPENVVFTYINKMRRKEWETKQRDAYLTGLMLDWHKWLYDAVREYHPAAKMMITLGWWTTYEKAADMYDVNMPNEYNAELNPDRLFQTNYDAAMAVAAARKVGKGKTVVYMPGMFDVLAGTKARPATIDAQRYCTFAPITRGVMGIFGWRLTRCTAEYRKKIVYPVMKEVSNFKDYFLGEWHDELVTSDHDKATVEYLKKYQERNSLVIGKDDGEYLNTVDMVPDVSHCLRRNPATGKYLLLAVNNRREPVKVTFKIDLEKLPASIKCAFYGTEAKINGKTMTCEFKRFGVHAFEFELGK